MPASILDLMDLIGTIAFALSGTMVAVEGDMDIFGVNILALVTAVGGGITRDLLIGYTPPRCFRDPFYVIVALITANAAFLFLYFRKKRSSKNLRAIYDRALFLFDTLGLAAFTVDGAMIGLNLPVQYNFFFPAFLGVITGVGGGVLRDVFCTRKPAIFVKQVYAVASLFGGILICLMARYLPEGQAEFLGFASILFIRALANHYKLDLPRVHQKA